MDNNLSTALKNAGEALLNVSVEAEKLILELKYLQHEIEKHEKINQGLKTVFDEYYGG